MKHQRTFFGRRVRIKLHDGSTYIDKFLNRRSRYFIFADHGRVPIESIKSMSIYQQRGEVKHAANQE